jgi:prophage antirepressor-like protein
VATDVCHVLGLGRLAQALSRLLSHEQRVRPRDTHAVPPQPALVMISQPGLYRLLFFMDTETSRRFLQWVCDVVLPHLRQPDEPTTPTTLESVLARLDALSGSVHQARGQGQPASAAMLEELLALLQELVGALIDARKEAAYSP